MKARFFPVFALLAASAVAQDAAPAGASPAPAEPEPESPPVRRVVQPGPSDRAMSPEMREYVARLESIRLERDAQTRAKLAAERNAEARKQELAEEREDVKALVDKAAELRAALAETEAALAGIWDADEEIVRFRSAAKAADEARAAKQREMQFAVQAAMRTRGARLAASDGDAPEIRSVESARAAANRERPEITIDGKSLDEFLAGRPVVVTNLDVRPPAPPRPAPGAVPAPSAE